MSLPEPTDVIAPRKDVPYETHAFIGQMLEGAYPYGVVLKYHGLRLYSHVDDDHRQNVWEIYTDDGDLIEVLNLDAFRTATALKHLLDEIVAYDPSDRSEWVSSR